MRIAISLTVALLANAGCAGRPGKTERRKTSMPTVEELTTRYDVALSFGYGLRLARERNKPVVLFFYHRWSFASLNLVRKVATDERVQDLLDNFVLVGIDINKDRATRKRFHVKGVPDVRFLNSEGEEIGRLTDDEPEAVAVQLERVLAEIGVSSR